MEIKLSMNDYIDINIRENGHVYVENGVLNTDGEEVAENMYANSSFTTIMKYLGIDVSALGDKISKYLRDNELLLRIKKDKNSIVSFNLHDATTKEELVSYDSFETLVSTEVLQFNNEI